MTPQARCHPGGSYSREILNRGRAAAPPRRDLPAPPGRSLLIREEVPVIVDPGMLPLPGWRSSATLSINIVTVPGP